MVDVMMNGLEQGRKLRGIASAHGVDTFHYPLTNLDSGTGFVTDLEPKDDFLFIVVDQALVFEGPLVALLMGPRFIESNFFGIWHL